MFGWLKSLLQGGLNAVLDALEAINGWLWSIVQSLWGAVWEIVVSGAVEMASWIGLQLPPGIASYFDFTDARGALAGGETSFAQLIWDVGWILPVGPVLSMVGGVYAVCFIVRLFRHSLRLLPSWSLG